METVIGLAILGALIFIAYLVWPKNDETPAVEEPSPAKPVVKQSKPRKPKVDLSTLKKEELKSLCAERGVAVKANDTKAVLIQKLES